MDQQWVSRHSFLQKHSGLFCTLPLEASRSKHSYSFHAKYQLFRFRILLVAWHGFYNAFASGLFNFHLIAPHLKQYTLKWQGKNKSKILWNLNFWIDFKSKFKILHCFLWHVAELPVGGTFIQIKQNTMLISISPQSDQPCWSCSIRTCALSSGEAAAAQWKCC